MTGLAKYVNQPLTVSATVFAINQFGVTPGLVYSAAVLGVSILSWGEGFKAGQEA